MCIVLVTTTHPNYALILIDNRDEYVMRPTSRPQWWTNNHSGHQVLSSRDLFRPERGTWMGVTRQGRLAVLTNYRETAADDEVPPSGMKSRGGMVTAWLGAPADQDLDEFVHQMLAGRLVKGVGGFSLICGDLKRKPDAREMQPLAVISNRSEAVDGVPWIGAERDRTWGLSNTVYQDPLEWPKIVQGKQLLDEAVRDAVDKDAGEDDLTDALFGVLDHETLPDTTGLPFADILSSHRHTIFVPAVTNEAPTEAGMERSSHEATSEGEDETPKEASGSTKGPGASDGSAVFEEGPYGTQRQTIILVDWDGNVTYKERALWDSRGNPIDRGKGDVTFRFHIHGWEEP